MAIRKPTEIQSSDRDPIDENQQIPDDEIKSNDLSLTFVDALPPTTRSAASGRSVTAATTALIHALKANPNVYALVDVRKASQPSASLRRVGVLEAFRRRDDGQYDRYAAYVGPENIPEPIKRGPRKPKDDESNGGGGEPGPTDE